MAYVTDMGAMFYAAKSFNADISEWNVARVTNMSFMFYRATSFNADISKWNVASVTDMQGIFFWAKSFNQTLCGATWVYSKARKDDMFTGSPGSISKTVCSGKCV